MSVSISISGEFTSMTVSEDAFRAYELYIGQDANLTLDEFLELLRRDGKIALENGKTGRKVASKLVT
jgi:hypothetical protein